MNSITDGEQERVKFLTTYFQEQLGHARHHETLRTSTTNVIMFLAAAAMTVVGLDKRIDRTDAPMGWLILWIGLVGLLISAKHYERSRFHTELAKSTRREIERRIWEPDDERTASWLYDKERKQHDVVRYHKLLAPARLNGLWFLLFLGVMFFGIYVLVSGLS